MKTLALEFSSERRSVALLADGQIRGAAADEGRRATGVLGLIELALNQANLEREQVECIAVGLGPGSYTGIRAAIAVAQGWQLASGVRLLGVSSAECLAALALSKGCFGHVNVVIDAQRSELYLAGYQVSPSGWKEVEPLRLAGIEEVRQRPGAYTMVVGPEATRWFPTGHVLFPDAATLAQLAVGRSDFVPGEKLEPIYLRETAFVKAPPPRIVS